MSASNLRRLTRDHALLHSPSTSFFLPPSSPITSLTSAHLVLFGPSSTPYAAGCFKLTLTFPTTYPTTPPTAAFRTKVYHPNIDERSGEVCVDLLKSAWTSKTSILDVVETIRGLLINPNPSSALNSDAALQMETDYKSFGRHAKLMTKIHAPVTREYAPFVERMLAEQEESSRQCARVIKQEEEEEAERYFYHNQEMEMETVPQIDFYCDEDADDSGVDMNAYSAASTPEGSPSPTIPSRVLAEITEEFLPDAITAPYRPSPLGKRSLEEAFQGETEAGPSTGRVLAQMRKSPKLVVGGGRGLGVNLEGRVRDVGEVKVGVAGKARKSVPVGKKVGQKARMGLRRL